MGYALQAQVGINNTNPQATLDISATNAASPSNTDGILIPRVDDFPSTDPTASQDGLMVFITGNGTPSKGFYYWDNTTTSWAAVTAAGGGTLDDAYDFGGAGSGNTITATDGAVTIAGEDGVLVTGNFGSGASIGSPGAGTRMFFNPRKAAFRAGFVNGAQWDDATIGNYSSAFGTNNIVNGQTATAFGDSNTVSGLSSFAAGGSNTITGSNSAALGLTNTISGDQSFAIGRQNTVSGDYSFSGGLQSSALGDFSLAYGENSTANGNYSFAFGEDNIASNLYAFAQGRDVEANTFAFASGEILRALGRGSVAFGQSNTTLGLFSAVFGRNNTSPSFGETTIGLYATEYTAASDISSNNNDRIFSIGNGTNPSARSNALTIFKSGLMNINDEYNMPLTDGTLGQVMITDGSGNVTFQTLPSGDADWYEAGTTNAPSNNTDNIFTLGHVGIGETDPDNPLHIGTITTFDLNFQNTGQDGIFIAGLGDNSGINAVGGSMSFGPPSSTRGDQRKSAISSVQTSGDVDHTGLAFYVHGNPINQSPMVEGMRLNHQGYLGINNTNPDATLDVVGTMQFVDGNETNGYVLASDVNGNANWTDPNTLISGDTTTASNGLTENTNDVQLGGPLTQATSINQGTNNFDINLNSTGDFAIQDNGTDVFFVEDSGEIGLGTSTPIYPIHMVETSPYNRGFYMLKTETSSSETAGIYVEKIGLGTGRNHAIFTETEGTGTGQKYGMFNRLTSTAAGNQYGVRNFLNGNTSAFQFGTFNNLANAATGNQYGTYNGMRGTAAANKYGTYNEFQEPITSATEIVGVRNRFTNGTPGAGGMSGLWTDFVTPANGTYYGSRNEFGAAATGTGNKYGTYNSFNPAAGGTHYGSYNIVSVANGWASYDLGKSYISERLSIGETDNPDGRISILNNSGGSNPAHIELRETAAGDGARIRFNNNIETANEWILFGLADNTVADSRFNVFHTTTGNVITATGDGDVGITGNADTDFHVFHGNNGNADGMKLQNTNDNTWWRMYVSSGSDDLRLFNSNNGTTIMGAFNDATGAYTATSDRRLKKDFKDLYFSWDNFMTMKPLTYKYKVDDKPTTYIGMVAQDVEKVYPELVTYHKDNDIYHMDYSATGIVAIKGVQELKKEVETLKSENEQLKARLSKLENLEARLLALETENKSNEITSSDRK